MAVDEVGKIAFVDRGSPRRARRRAAVIALQGARRADLGSALALASAFDRQPLLIAVDGGLSVCRALRRPPDLFVGDLDSARRHPVGIASRIYPAAKDFSDFSGALIEARRLGADVVVIGGLLGGRLDHEWANILEAGSKAPEFAGVLAPSSRGLIIVTATGVRMRTVPRRDVSVFAIGRGAQVSLRGTAWTMAKRRLAAGSLGLSNVTGAQLALDVHEGVAAVVFPGVRTLRKPLAPRGTGRPLD